MKNHITILENEEFKNIRMIMINDEPWFVASDVANALGYTNARDAIRKHVDEEDKDVAKCDTLGGKQKLTIINESGLYGLIFGSTLPSAKRFKKWVTSEVLPSIRKYGAYLTDEILLKAIDDPDYLNYIHGLLLSDKKQRILTTPLSVKSDDLYRHWSIDVVTPLLVELQKYYPHCSTSELLNAVYRCLNIDYDIDVHKMKTDFIQDQLKTAAANNITNVVSNDFQRIPVLYVVYKNDTCRNIFMKTLYEFIETEIDNCKKGDKNVCTKTLLGI